jgi:hypothetical protein
MSSAGEVFIFGIANSLHCAGMCGPLSACLQGGRTGAAAYHAGRVASYSAVGGVVGALGALFVGDSTFSTGWLSIAMAAVLLLGAVGAPRFSASLGTAPLLTAALRRLHALSPIQRGLGVGLLTPLLPCGVLYVAGGTALLTGSPLGGAATMLVFALGSLPALLLVQLNFGWLGHRLGSTGRRRLFRGLMLLASAVLLYRGIMDVGGGGCCTH